MSFSCATTYKCERQIRYVGVCVFLDIPLEPTGSASKNARGERVSVGGESEVWQLVALYCPPAATKTGISDWRKAKPGAAYSSFSKDIFVHCLIDEARRGDDNCFEFVQIKMSHDSLIYLAVKAR